MIEQKIYTGFDEMILRVRVKSEVAQDIFIVVKDSERQNTVLLDRFAPVGPGEHYDFLVPLPQCRRYVTLQLMDQNGGDTFEYIGFSKEPLIKRLDIIDFKTYHLQEFVSFIKKFCYNCGELRTNDAKNDQDYYKSREINPHFFIKYLDVITDHKTGVPLPTPAHINLGAPLIEVSKKYFKDYTVPGRVAILLHEYCHPYANTNPNDESEADLNGLIIYLGLGYPKWEAQQVWLQIFSNTDTVQNENREKMIHNFIEDFDNMQMIMNQ